MGHGATDRSGELLQELLTLSQSFRAPFQAEKQGCCCACSVCQRPENQGTDSVKLENQGWEGAQRLIDMGFLFQGEGGGGCSSLRPFLYRCLCSGRVMLTRVVCFSLSLR